WLSNRRDQSGFRSLDDRDLHSAGHGLLRSVIARPCDFCRGENLPQRRHRSCRCHFLQGSCDANDLRKCELMESVHCVAADTASAKSKAASNTSLEASATALVGDRRLKFWVPAEIFIARNG